MGIFDRTSHTPLGQLGNQIVNTGLRFAKSKVATNKMPYFNAAVGALNGGLMSGNWQGALESAGNAFINSGGIANLFKSNPHSVVGRWLNKNPLHANLTMAEVQDIAMQIHHLSHVRKNLFLISITPYSGSVTGNFGKALSNRISTIAGNSVGGLIGGKIGGFATGIVKQAVNSAMHNIPIINSIMEQGGGISAIHNLLATDISYTPFSLDSEQWNVGASIIDGVKSSQQSEITITTYDDDQGSIKHFFKQLASDVVHKDGTVGVQADGLVEIRILHGFVSNGSNLNGFEETFVCRPVSTDYELSRKDDNLQEIQLRFIQTDTFI